MRGSSRALISLIAAAVLCIAVVFAFDLIPWVRGGFGWRWEYDPLPLSSWLLPALLMAVYLLGAVLLLRRRIRLRWALAWSFAFSIALAVAVTAAQEGDAIYGLFARSISKLATGQHWLSLRVGWEAGEWRTWTEVMRYAGGHLSNLPPGLPMAYAGLTGLFGLSPTTAEAVSALLLPYQCHNFELLNYPPQAVASSLFGVLMPLWAALTVFPLASAARRLSGAPASYWAVLWWPLTPALMAFAGSFNTIYPLLSLSALLALMNALDASTGLRRTLWAAVSGLLCGVAVFMNFAFAPLPLLLGLFASIYGLGTRRMDASRLIWLAIVYSAGVALPWLLFALATGLTPFDLLRTAFEFHLGLDRPYAFWTVMHIWDWLIWGGLGLAGLTVAGVWRARRAPDAGASLSLALIVGMLLITLSGTARGETGRVWLVFTPLLVLSAADGLRRLQGDGDKSWTAIAAANAVLALVLALSIPVVGIDLTPPPQAGSAIADRPVNAQFVDANDTPLFRLIGWDIQQNSSSLDVILSFMSQRRPSEPYYLGSVLVLPDGPSARSEPQQPLNADGETVPATCWTPDQISTVRFSQPVPADTSTSAAYLSVAIYGAAPGAGPLRVQTSEGSDAQVGLGPFAVTPP